MKFYVSQAAPRTARPRKVHPPAARNLSRRNPTERFRRLANGMRVPASIRRDLDERRLRVSEALSARSQLHRDKSAMSDEAFTAAEKQVEERLREAQQLSGRTARKLEALHVEKYKSASTTYEHLIRRNPRKFHRLLRPKLSQPCETCDESSGPSTQQSDEFREFFAALLRSRLQRASLSQREIYS